MHLITPSRRFASLPAALGLALAGFLGLTDMAQAAAVSSTGGIIILNGRVADRDSDASTGAGPVESRVQVDGVGSVEGTATTLLGRNSARASATISHGAEPNCSRRRDGTLSCLPGRSAEASARSMWTDELSFGSEAGNGGLQQGVLLFRFDGQLAGAALDPLRGSSSAIANIRIAFDPDDDTDIGTQDLVEQARWDNTQPALSVSRILRLVFEFVDGEAMAFLSDLDVVAAISSKARVDDQGELVQLGDTGSVQADFSHTLEFIGVELPPGYSMRSASGHDYFAVAPQPVPAPPPLALLALGLAGLAARPASRARTAGRAQS